MNNEEIAQKNFKVDPENEASHKLCRPFADEIIEKQEGTIYMKLVT